MYHILLQIVFLQIVISFQCWAVEYGLITRETSMDLKSITSIQADLNRLSPDDASQEYIVSHCLHAS